LSDDEKITCRTPTKGRDGATRIPRWKYDCIRRAILDEIDNSEEGMILFGQLPAIVRGRLTSHQLTKLGSVRWHVTTVKLNMEVEGELERVPRSNPQTLRKTV